ncbi:HPP family protein [Neptunicella marina]|uniref:CBS domain-containing protein n=1 Tax=Neptunicella marina TaxID=2125989 RepID=A0A8J6IUY7_9ALTE|nr:CBS domain-containing protein [Neptunicella marina]MBC3767830.1 CBS domain-containing protein [Neptunicella marina]
MKVQDIMSSHLKTLGPDATLHDAHNLSRELGVRHIPVVDDDGNYIAVVTQKALIAKVMGLVSHYDKNQLAEQEKAISIRDVYVPDCTTIQAGQNLLDIAEYFLNFKHGCLPVVATDGKLQGIVTSSDFVKLAIRLLQQQTE